MNHLKSMLSNESIQINPFLTIILKQIFKQVFLTSFLKQGFSKQVF